jgi:hypothetical protein
VGEALPPGGQLPGAEEGLRLTRLGLFLEGGGKGADFSRA